MTADFTGRLDQIEERLEQLGNELADFSQQLSEHTANILTLQTLGTQLLEIVRIQNQQVAADREAFRQEMRLQQQEFRNEIRQIWEYLLAQHPNGNEGNQ